MAISSSPSPTEQPSAVFFWAPLGGGHKTAKDALQQRLTDEYAAKGQKLDTTADYDITGEKILSYIRIPFIGGLGEIGANAWNNAQKAGNLSYLTRFAALNWIGEFLLWPLVYFRVKYLLSHLDHEPRHIISTQAFCLNAIARAVLSVNRSKGWNMHIDVHLTDLPSKKATHFFPSVRRATANPKLRDLITLHAPHPLVKKGATEADFWKKHCGNAHVICSDVYPIRKAFMETKTLGAKLSAPSIVVPLKINHPQEPKILDCGIQDAKGKHYDITINKRDKVGFLMLGSQPTTDSVLSWLHSLVNAAPNLKTSAKGKVPQQYFFLYCGTPEKEGAKNPLLSGVRKEIEHLRAHNRLPKNLHIVPFTNQDAEVISLLMARSDMTITRSGGATSMELLQLHQSPDIPKRQNRLTFIHSEALTRPKDSQICKDFESHLQTLLEKIHASRGPRVHLSHEEWDIIAKELASHCKRMGISTTKTKEIVSSILSLYKKGHAPAHTIIRNILKTFSESSSETSSQSIAREKKITKMISALKRKQKYTTVSSEKLRKIAIRKLLVDEGIILWEGKNAKYLQEKLGAEVVNPEFAKDTIREKFFISESEE